MKNLKTDQNIRRSTWIRILTKFIEGFLQYNASKALPKANLLTTKFSVSQIPKLHQHIVKVLVMATKGSDTMSSNELSFLKKAMRWLNCQN